MGGTMAKIRYGKRCCWILPVGVLLTLFAVITAQRPGFLSISCGGKTNHTDANNMTWVADSPYIDVGEAADIGDASASASAYGSYLHTLRSFPNALDKSCYRLPLAPNETHLLRLWFVIGNYGGYQTLPRFSFSIETVDMLAEQIVILTNTDAKYYERILASSGTVLYVCLIRTYQTDNPFISAIELRTLRNGMYDGQAKPGTMLNSIWRISVGGINSKVRYPQDNFDRLWTSNLEVNVAYSGNWRSVSSTENISTNNTEDVPPIAVMQTACVANNPNGMGVDLSSSQGSKTLLVLYFAEIEMVTISQPRSFYVSINGRKRSEIITLVRNYSAVELTFLSNATSNGSTYSFRLRNISDSTLLPILNAFEYYWLVHTEQATYSQDIGAIDDIKRRFDIKEWISDPCYLIPWVGIGCSDQTSSPIRILEIDLSGRNLTGTVPNDLAKLTALVNV